MAEQHSKAENVISKAQRRYTVGYLPNGKDTPAIKLSGHWLTEAGFATGTGVTVKIAGDCIVLIPDSPQDQAIRKELAQIKNVLRLVKQDVLS